MDRVAAADVPQQAGVAQLMPVSGSTPNAGAAAPVTRKGTRWAGVEAVGGPSINRLRAAGVGASKTFRRVGARPRTACTRSVSRAASSEWPPSSKKLSSGPTLGTPRTSANWRHIRSSRRSRGGSAPVAAAQSGSGSRSRSSFPLTPRAAETGEQPGGHHGIRKVPGQVRPDGVQIASWGVT
ncbi:hypothetical protein SANTM175S_04380 [Streptomyces antimycoticus]